MTTTAEVKAIVANYASEADRVSLQPSSLLLSEDGRDQLAIELVALANRDGGRLILGVDRQGRFEEALAREPDAAGTAIEQVVRERVSPPLVVESEFLTGEEGALLVFKVGRRSGQPHAVGQVRSGGKVRARQFVARVGGQSRPVTDAQLGWMFRVQNDPGIDREFPLTLYGSPGNLAPTSTRPQPRAADTFRRLLARLDPGLGAEIASDAERRQAALVELAAWAFLDDLSDLLVDNDGEQVSLDDLPVPERGSVFAGVDGGLRAVVGGAVPRRGLGRLFGRGQPSRSYVLPRGCEVQVDALRHQQKVRVMLAHPTWIATFAAQAAGAGDLAASEAPDNPTVWTRLELSYACSFPFPTTDEAAEAGLGFPETLRRHLETRWNALRFDQALARGDDLEAPS